MLKNSFLPVKNVRKLAKMVIILIIITYIFIGVVMPKSILAAQIKSTYTQGKLANYPGYEELIKKLKTEHPNWNFTILETGLDWNEVIKNETVASHGRNLIWKTFEGNWVCSTCGNAKYDNGNWKCASEMAVSYYMDPRNWLNDNNIFQFEDLSYNGNVQNIEGVNKILNSVSWANGNTVTYTKTDGSKGVINKSYAQIIMESAKEAGISPYHLAARIKQEQGTERLSGTGTGNISGYIGYYNFCNIGATGSGNSAVLANGLNYAKNKGWDDPEKSIKAGAIFIASNYISRGQSTLYLQKFDVDNSEGSLYYHQYMQNVSAATTEGNTVKSSYESMGLLEGSINFVIPVYNNMPQETSPSPDGVSIVTQNVKVTGNEVAVRSDKSTSSAEITKVNSNDILLRIEIAVKKENGYYWDKVVLPNGQKGYIARDFIQKIEDVTNANISAVANTGVNLRNGPGTSNTKVIVTLTSGQPVTIIENGKYNGLDGFNWSRVKLSNGIQGYIATEFLNEVAKSTYSIAYINGVGVRIREGAGTNYNIVTCKPKGEKVTVLQKNVANADGCNWDKIVTSDGLEGYIANNYLTYEATCATTEACDVDNNGKVNSTDLFYIIKFLKDNPDGYDKTYDVNKDGKINSGDLYQIILYLKQH